MKFIYNDGGRRAAGFNSRAGDCVTRAIAIATEQPYSAVYKAMALGNARQRMSAKERGIKELRANLRGKTYRRPETASHGINVRRKWFKDYMTALGWKWTPTMAIGVGCKVHLVADELPMGRLIVSVSKHYTSVIDGVIHDTHNPSADRGVTIYPHGYEGKLPSGAYLLENGNGYGYAPERCVYGYWSK